MKAPRIRLAAAPSRHCCPSPAPLRKALRRRRPTATQPAQQGATFESLDTNSDGRISKEEASVNASVSQQFSKYDKNGNGYIEKEEVSASNTAPPEKPGQ